MIIERLRAHKVPVERVVCCGGIAEKNPMLMQIYADVTGCSLEIARSGQACALGAALTAAVLAGKEKGGFASFEEARNALTGVRETVYQPNPQAAAVYEQLFTLYQQLHDAFGGVATVDLSGVMKDLLRIRREQTAGFH
jgi:L-ribulokinase